MGTASTVTKKKPRGKPFAKGQSGNPQGAPKRGESWAELIKSIGEMDGQQVSDFAGKLGSEFATLPQGVTLKSLVVIRVFGALLNDPQPGLLSAFMDRAEGKVKDEQEHSGAVEIIVTYTDRSTGLASGAADDQA